MAGILHAIDTTGPGGAETIYLQLAEKTAEEGHRTIALVRGKGWVYDELKRLKIPTHIIDCKGSFNLGYLAKLVRLVRAEKLDVIQSHLLGSNVYCSLAGMITGVRVVSTFHGLVDISPDEQYRMIKLMALRLGSDQIVTVTKRIEEFVRSQPLLKADRIKTIYNGIQIEAFERVAGADFRKSIGVEANDLLIGSLGNIRTPKNYPLAIDTVRELHSRGVKAHYAIAGQGSSEQMKPLIDLVSRYQLQSYIHFLGFTENTQNFLSSLDIFLMTSSSEGHPLALTQAMANGLPIVTTQSGVEEIVVDRKEALISVDHTCSALADLAETLKCGDRTDNPMTIAAKEKAKSLYSLEVMFNSYFGLYGFS